MAERDLIPESETRILVPSTNNLCSLPVSAVLLSHSKEFKAKGLESSVSSVPLGFGENSVSFHINSADADELKNLVCEGYLPRSVLNIQLKVQSSFQVWGESFEALSIFRYLHRSDRTGILNCENNTNLFILICEDDTSGVLQLLEKSDSNFLSCVLRMKKFKLEPIPLPDSCKHILENISDVPEPSPVPSENRQGGFWDANAIEKWRIPNSACSGLIRRIKEQNIRRRNDETFSLMQKVRESYVAKGNQKKIRFTHFPTFFFST